MIKYKELSRYAFTGYDCNKSWKLDRREIYFSLKNILKGSLDKQQIACLTDFLMRQGSYDDDDDDDVLKGEFNISRVKKCFSDFWI